MEMPKKPTGASARHFVHGLAHTSIDNAYKSMISRCYKETNKRYPVYGGRGITVCDLWKNDKKEFFQWAFNNGYQEGLTLDRIDTNKNYCPENCRWTTQKVQQNNRTNNHHIIVDGIDKNITQWSEFIGVSTFTLRCKIKKGIIEEYIRSKINDPR